LIYILKSYWDNFDISSENQIVVSKISNSVVKLTWKLSKACSAKSEACFPGGKLLLTYTNSGAFPLADLFTLNGFESPDKSFQRSPLLRLFRFCFNFL